VLAGPEGAHIPAFNIYDRWGQAVFQVHDGIPGDPRYGWDGTCGGKPMPSGAYVYIVVITGAGGQQQVYKGTVILVR
jgi:gliding motility-associated-like protein